MFDDLKLVGGHCEVIDVAAIISVGFELFAGIHEDVFYGKMSDIHVIAAQMLGVQAAAFFTTPRKNGGLSAGDHLSRIASTPIELAAENFQVLFLHAVHGELQGGCSQGIDTG